MASRVAAAVALVCLLGGAALLGYAFLDLGGGYERACVTLTDAETGETYVVSARVADTPAERYRGLSGTESLANGTGMLFVFPEEGVQTFVMRDMNYPLDIVFAGADGRVTVVHRAPVESDGNLTPYRGRAKWVLEVPYGWAASRGIEGNASGSGADRLTVRRGGC